MTSQSRAANSAFGITLGLSILTSLVAFQMLPSSAQAAQTEAGSAALSSACRTYELATTQGGSIRGDLEAIKEAAQEAHKKTGKKGQIVTYLEDIPTIQQRVGVVAQASDTAARTENLPRDSFDAFVHLNKSIGSLGLSIAANETLDVAKMKAPIAIKALSAIDDMCKGK